MPEQPLAPPAAPAAAPRADQGGPDGAEALDRTFKEGGRLLVLRCTQYLLAFISGLVVARALGPVGRAEYILPLTLATSIWVVVHLSLEAAAARMLARREASVVDLGRLLSAATLALGALGAMVTVLVGLRVQGGLLGGASDATVILAAATIPFTLAGQMAAALLLRIGGLRAFGWISAASGALQLLLVGALELGVGLSPEVTIAVSLVTIAATGLSLPAALAAKVGWRALVPALPRGLAGRALRTGAALHLSSIALFLNLRIDLLLVSALDTTEAAGLYSLATMLAEVVFLLTWTLALSALATQTSASPAVAARYTADFIRQSVVVAAGFALVTCLGAYPLVRIVYGSEWSGAVAPLLILSVGAVALAIEAPARGMLLRIARPRAVSLAALAALAVNVGANLALIPVLGIAGSAIASVLSYWCAAALMLGMLVRRTDVRTRDVLSLPRGDDLVLRGARALGARLGVPVRRPA